MREPASPGASRVDFVGKRLTTAHDPWMDTRQGEGASYSDAVAALRAASFTSTFPLSTVTESPALSDP